MANTIISFEQHSVNLDNVFYIKDEGLMHNSIRFHCVNGGFIDWNIPDKQVRGQVYATIKAKYFMEVL